MWTKVRFDDKRFQKLVIRVTKRARYALDLYIRLAEEERKINVTMGTALSEILEGMVPDDDQDAPPRTG